MNARTAYTGYLRSSTVDSYIALMEATTGEGLEEYYFNTMGDNLSLGIDNVEFTDTGKLNDLMAKVLRSRHYINGLSLKNIFRLLSVYHQHKRDGEETVEFYKYLYTNWGNYKGRRVELGDRGNLYDYSRLIGRLLNILVDLGSTDRHLEQFSIFLNQVNVLTEGDLPQLIENYHYTTTDYKGWLQTLQYGIEDESTTVKITYLLDEYRRKIGVALASKLPILTTTEELVSLMQQEVGCEDMLRVNKTIYLIYKELGKFITTQEEGISEFTFHYRLADITFEAWSKGPVITEQDTVKRYIQESLTQTKGTPLLDKHPGLKQYITAKIHEWNSYSVFTLVEVSHDEEFLRAYHGKGERLMCPARILFQK